MTTPFIIIQYILYTLNIGNLINAQTTSDLHEGNKLLYAFFKDDHIIQKHR